MPGGSVEPLDRTAVLKDQFRIPDPPARQRFELRDPFAEVTYRTHSFEDMVRKAERLEAARFVAIAPDGKRTTLSKHNGEWQRPEPDLRRSSPSLPEDRQHAGSTNGPKVPVDTFAVDRFQADAERTARAAAVEARLNERYVIKRAPLRIGDVMIGQTEYWHRGDTSRLAFTESTFRVSTETTSPSVAKSMVDVAEARRWQALRVSGNDDFKRLIWLEASVRDIKTVGYEPLLDDHETLRKTSQRQQSQRSDAATASRELTPNVSKQSALGSGGRKAVIAALESVLVAQGVPESQRHRVMQAAADNLAQRLHHGETHRVRVYDKSAPMQRRPGARPRTAADEGTISANALKTRD